MNEQTAVEILEELNDAAKSALMVTGFYDKAFEGKEIDVTNKLFLGSVRLLNQKTAALSEAVEFIESLKDSGVDVEPALEKINKELVGVSFEEYTPLRATVN